MGHADDVLSIAGIGSLIFTASSDGTIRKWNKNFDCVQTLYEHTGIVFCLAVYETSLLSGSNDKEVKVLKKI